MNAADSMRKQIVGGFFCDLLTPGHLRLPILYKIKKMHKRGTIETQHGRRSLRSSNFAVAMSETQTATSAKQLSKTDLLLAGIREGRTMTRRQQAELLVRLSLPAMLAQIATIVMNYIDASMVGHLGAEASASIGLVSTSIWLFAGICSALSMGFSVQVAHLIGANDVEGARSVLRQALITALLFGAVVGIIGAGVSPHLPSWLGGNADIADNASSYFFIFSLVIPVLQIDILASAMLRCSGNILFPSLLNAAMCVFDVIFNFFLIYGTREVSLGGAHLVIPGAGFGVPGAALGTACAELLTAVIMVYYLLWRSPLLKIFGTNRKPLRSFLPTRQTLRKALTIGTPMGIQHIAMCSAQILTTIIVAPLGTFAIAAHSFGITAESLCYMPGYGIQDAATTLVGQSYGAGRKSLAKQFAYIAVALGIGVMTLMGILLYAGAPVMMSVFTPVEEIIRLGTGALRIEAFAEPMFAASIVAYGCCVGAGDTLKPAVMNLCSMWGVRLTLAFTLVRYGGMGLNGVWTAMAIELTFRGIIFLIRLVRGKWLK